MCLSFSANTQLNMNLLSNLDYQTLHDADLNDIWGYVDETGKEYALVGTTKGTSVVDISDPANPVEVFWEPGTESVWRDLKTWGDYAYITTEAQDGILIIDLSPLPGSTNLPTSYYFGEGFPPLVSAHNIYIDEIGRAYIFGSNRGVGGVQILDVDTDPMNPTTIGSFEEWYVHDGYVRNDTMYLAHILDGFFSIVDISDLQNPIVLGTKNTPSNFSHNIWPSDNGQFVYTTDEVSGAFLGAYDITDPSNIIEVDRIQSSPGAGVIPHNVHVYGNFIVTSYYSDGIVVHDATYPYNLIEVAHYDTYPTQTTSYDGCWGAYPYLPSGIALATDREYGLFVLGVNYQQAAYLEGTVTDAVTTNPIQNVQVTITGQNSLNPTNSSGEYATGTAAGGMIEVTYHKPGYYSVVENVTLTQGVITINDVELIPIPPYSISITVLDAATSNPIPDAFVRFDGEFLTHEGATNGLGVEDLTLFYEEDYLVTAGIWGYKTKCITQFIDASTGSLVIELEKGYYDDFSFDFGWVTGGDAETGHWTRGIPFGTQENANPNVDAPWDCGKYAYVTGNTPDFDFTVDNVHEGEVILFSPIMDLTTYTNPHVNYARWFYAKYGPLTTPDDSMRIYLSNGSETILIESVGESVFNNEWNYNSARVEDFLPVTTTMQIIVQTSDYLPNNSVVEGGFDWFYLSEYNTTSIDETQQKRMLELYPNPFTNEVTIKNGLIGETYEIWSVNGQILKVGIIHSSNEIIDVSQLAPGIYIFNAGLETKRIVKN